jgi:hypothetical protein
LSEYLVSSGFDTFEIVDNDTQNQKTADQGSMVDPKTLRKAFTHLGWAGQAGAVTRLPSTTLLMFFCKTIKLPQSIDPIHALVRFSPQSF